MKKMIAVILSLAFMITLLPTNCFAASNNTHTTLEATTKAPIRKKAAQSGEVLAYVDVGDLLICTNVVYNQYNNKWFAVTIPATNETGFIFSSRVRLHQCSFQAVTGSESMKFCSCGRLINETKGIQRMNVATATQDVLSPDLAVALGTFIGVAKGAAAAAVPYVAVAGAAVVAAAAFSGMIYLAVNVTETSVSVEQVSPDWKKLDKKYKPEEGVFYNGMMYKGDRYLFVDIAHPMDTYEAVDLLDLKIGSYLYSPLGKKDKPLWFVYTFHDYDALYLVEEYLKIRPMYTCNYRTDGHASGCLMKQYLHYHIVPKYGNTNDHLGGHILYDSPMLGQYSGGAWATT